MKDFESFAHDVHDAFGRLYDRAYLREHPLARSLFADSPLAAERLHRLLIDSLEWLRPLGGENPQHAEWRRYRYLQLRYLEGVAPEEIARELLVSTRQARRDHGEALDELARLLWDRLVPTSPPAPPTTRRLGNLESELSKIVAVAGPKLIRVDEVLGGVVDTARQLAEANHVDINLTLEPDLPTAETSRPVLRQLLLNLLADAIVRHPGSKLAIQAARSYDGIDIVLRTRATGASQPELVSDESLILASRLAQSQHLLVQPMPPLPGADADLAILVRLPFSSIRSLLLVDDNPDVALLFRRFLSDTSFRLIQARSADRALRLAREVLPDVLVLDLLLPSTDGWEVLQALRADPSTVDIPVVVSSVLPDHAIARSLGVSEFLPKPVTRVALLAVLDGLVPHNLRAVRGRGQPEASA